jgi:hypothetical protein
VAKVQAERKEVERPAASTKPPALALRRVEGKIAKLTKREGELGEEVKAIEAKLDQLRATREKAQRDLAQAREQAKDYRAAMVAHRLREGGVPSVEVLRSSLAVPAVFMGTEYESRLQQMLDDVGSFATKMHEVAVAQAEKTSTSGAADASQQLAKRARSSDAAIEQVDASDSDVDSSGDLGDEWADGPAKGGDADMGGQAADGQAVGLGAVGDGDGKWRVATRRRRGHRGEAFASGRGSCG